MSQNFSSARYVSTSSNATLFITTIKSHTEYDVFFKHYLNLFHFICNLFRVGKNVINKEKNNFNNYCQIILTIRQVRHGKYLTLKKIKTQWTEKNEWYLTWISVDEWDISYESQLANVRFTESSETFFSLSFESFLT